MSLLCVTTPEAKRGKQVKYLVHDLGHFEDATQDLFELSADCLPTEAGATEAAERDAESTAQDSSRAWSLFRHRAPVPMKGRQTYRMWKAALELSTGLWFKSDLLDKPKTLHFFPLEHVPLHVTAGFRIPGFDLVQFLVHFLKGYFPGLDIRLEPLHDISGVQGLASRHHQKTGKRQFLVTDLHAKLHALTATPARHFLLGLTWTDLYPSEELNFVLGEASFRHRCAVLSFGRYEPLSYEGGGGHSRGDGGQEESEEEEEEEKSVVVDGALMWKLLRVVTHETSHLFGLNHCVFFDCAMNESGSVAEALSQPLTLCPVCLRKVQRFLGFRVRQRYADLLEVCRKVQESYPSDGMGRTVDWLSSALEFLQ